MLVRTVAVTSSVGQAPSRPSIPGGPSGPTSPVKGTAISISGQSYIGGGGSGSVQLDIRSKFGMASVYGRPHVLLANTSAIYGTI